LADSESNFNDIIDGLRYRILNYFISAAGDVSWIRNSFLFLENPENMSVQDYASVIDITSDLALRQNSCQALLTEF
jgi:hypothetical protein